MHAARITHASAIKHTREWIMRLRERQSLRASSFNRHISNYYNHTHLDRAYIVWGVAQHHRCNWMQVLCNFLDLSNSHLNLAYQLLQVQHPLNSASKWYWLHFYGSSMCAATPFFLQPRLIFYISLVTNTRTCSNMNKNMNENVARGFRTLPLWQEVVKLQPYKTERARDTHARTRE